MTINTESIRSLPLEVRTWICDERESHIPYFKLRNQKKVVYDPVKWMRRFRKLFTEATKELADKTKLVRAILSL